jgi:hypothetical protein
MLNGKALAFAAVGAVLAAAVWAALAFVTGWNLWLLAPVVGGAAGFGMMRATKMRGGVAPGFVAAAVTVVAILGARYVVVSHTLDGQLEARAIEEVTSHVAEEMEQQDADVFNDAGEYKPEVKARAREAWAKTSETDCTALISAIRSRDGATSGLGMLFDLGIFGLICTGLAAATAFKSAGMTLEKALVDKGLADGSNAAEVAARMRSEDSAPATGWRLPVRPGEKPAATQTGAPQAPRAPGKPGDPTDKRSVA